jgi:hypothetical protein
LYLDGHQQAIKPMQTNFTANGYALYAFDLSHDLADEGHFNLTRQGGVSVNLKFGASLPNTVTIVAYAVFENVIEIDRNRNVVFDFGS